MPAAQGGESLPGGDGPGEDASVWPSPMFRDLTDELQRLSRRKSKEYDGSILEASAFAILWILYDGAPRTLRDLTEELGLEQSTVNRQVNAAIRQGYLQRYEVVGSVSKMLRPTDKGREAFAHDGRLRAERLERVFDDLAPGTPEALLHELRAFNQAYERAILDERRRER